MQEKRDKVRGSKLSHEFDIAYKKWLKRRGFEDTSAFSKRNFEYAKQQPQNSDQ